MTDTAIEIRDLTGAALVAALDSLADLRTAVFRAFPYLYDGGGQSGHAQESAYLMAYANSPGALIAGAFAQVDGREQLVGAATAAPMADHAAEFAAPFLARGMDIANIFYFGESVLLPQWRGHGVGHGFFDRREARARELGFAMTSFCAVVRADDHPERPADYSPLDPFWRKRGYTPIDGLIAQVAWKETDQDGKQDHAMQFWVKTL